MFVEREAMSVQPHFQTLFNEPALRRKVHVATTYQYGEEFAELRMSDGKVKLSWLSIDQSLESDLSKLSMI